VSGVTFGATELPDRQAATLRKAVRYEWITIAFLAARSPWSGWSRATPSR
jgi:hypothetical protein